MGAIMSATSEVNAAAPASVLAPDGTLAEGYAPTLDDDALLSAWRAMLLSRAFDERAFSLQRQGRLGTFSTVNGEEAAVIGTAWALDPARDWVVPQYRELPAMLRQGFTLKKALQYSTGDPAGNHMPEGVNVLPFQISLAAQIPHAVGLAWGLRHQGSEGVVVVYFGDGASSEGDAHEAMNLAGVRRAPVIFVLKNNGWAISTPVSKQTAAQSFAARAEGYGFPGELVDGNDLFAVYDATCRAVARARAGDGPTLLEVRTYRMGPHNTSDDHLRYVDPADLEERRAADPIDRLRRYLTARELIDETSEASLGAEIKVEIEAAVQASEGGSRPGAEALFDHVYADPPERLLRQRAAATKEP
ncbi:MAG: thiamine pyrophosphate-dependent dehydrogenase E1 component subunit alpha [Solirubrobacterales bacterium]|nr:thiamine pyrophosphate-dependent dehydrogenase E1 component subunit alpha [Solirubrobacterales bacterium]